MSCFDNETVSISLLGTDVNKSNLKRVTNAVENIYNVTEDNEVFFKALPKTLDLSINREKYNSARCKFGQSVLNELKPHTEPGGILTSPTPCTVNIGNKVVAYMILPPDGIRIGRDRLMVELRDPLMYLKHGDIDISGNNIDVKTAYKEAAYAAENFSSIFNGIRFPGDVNQEIETVYTWQEMFSPSINADISIDMNKNPKEIYEDELEALEEKNKRNIESRKKDQENNEKIVANKSAIDLHNVKPIKVFEFLNEEFGFQTWVSTDGYINVGKHESDWKNYLAAPDDNRILKMNDHSISAPRDPIKQVIVRGKRVHKQGQGWLKQGGDKLKGFTQSGDQKDYRVEGFAVNTNVRFGEVEVIKKNKANKSIAGKIAKSQLIEKQRDQWSGSLKINPEKSGSHLNNPKDIKIGDVVSVVPPDETLNGCWSDLWIDSYNIRGVDHSFNGSSWDLDLEVIPINDSLLNPKNIKAGYRLFDPDKNKYVDGSEKVYGEIQEGLKDLELGESGLLQKSIKEQS